MGKTPLTRAVVAVPTRTSAEDALVSQTANRLREHGAPELAAVVEHSRIKLYPWASGRHRYKPAHVQVQVVVSVPQVEWSGVPLPSAEIDRLLRAELGRTLSPALFPRSIEIQAA
jgi:hypothetical protein